MATNTHKTYAAGWNKFSKFLGQGKVLDGPVTSGVIQRFVAWLSLHKFAPSTITTYVSAVGFYHKSQGWADPTNVFLVSKLLEGCRRLRPSTDTRLPISMPILLQTVQSLPAVCTSVYEACLFKAAFLSAFFGFMRVGEFAADSRHRVQPSVLTVADVQFCDAEFGGQSVIISFKCAKNNQCGSPQIIRLEQSDNAALCPVTALKEFLHVRPHAMGPLFCHFNGTPLTRFQFNAVLQKSLRFAQVPSDHIRAHSFRIGAASSAASAGISRARYAEWGDGVLMRLTRTFALYHQCLQFRACLALAQANTHIYNNVHM